MVISENDVKHTLWGVDILVHARACAVCRYYGAPAAVVADEAMLRDLLASLSDAGDQLSYVRLIKPILNSLSKCWRLLFSERDRTLAVKTTTRRACSSCPSSGYPGICSHAFRDSESPGP